MNRTWMNRKRVGDLVRFFTWSGWSYHSKRVWVIEEYKPIEWILNIRIFNTGIKLPSWLFAEWGTKFCHDLAALDFISPSTGEALRDVLVGMNGKIPEEGIEAQVIRWKV